jgi:S1-C subfamily serine protease
VHLRPGHSGGPLVDVYGHVVGINTMMAGPDVGLAIPVSVVQGFVRQVRLPYSWVPFASLQERERGGHITT